MRIFKLTPRLIRHCFICAAVGHSHGELGRAPRSDQVDVAATNRGALSSDKMRSVETRPDDVSSDLNIVIPVNLQG